MNDDDFVLLLVTGFFGLLIGIALMRWVFQIEKRDNQVRALMDYSRRSTAYLKVLAEKLAPEELAALRAEEEEKAKALEAKNKGKMFSKD